MQGRRTRVARERDTIGKYGRDLQRQDRVLERRAGAPHRARGGVVVSGLAGVARGLRMHRARGVVAHRTDAERLRVEGPGRIGELTCRERRSKGAQLHQQPPEPDERGTAS